MTGRLLGGDVQPLAEAVGLHAVGQAVGDHLRLRPLLERSTVAGSTPNTRARWRCGCRRRCVNASIRPGVLGEVGDAAQLDLVVVGDEQLAARRGDERLAEQPALLAAHRDVVQVRLVG